MLIKNRIGGAYAVKSYGEEFREPFSSGFSRGFAGALAWLLTGFCRL
jgi:hypothetical protein